jgi:hypothetical protein
MLKDIQSSLRTWTLESNNFYVAKIADGSFIYLYGFNQTNYKNEGNTAFKGSILCTK